MKKVLMALGIMRLFGIIWSIITIVQDLRKRGQMDDDELKYYISPTGYLVVFTKNYIEWFPSKWKVDLLREELGEGLI
jgi:hypothetical protein